MKKEKGQEYIAALSRAYSETWYFICYISKLFKYFTNFIVFVNKKVISPFSNEKVMGKNKFHSRTWQISQKLLSDHFTNVIIQ